MVTPANAFTSVVPAKTAAAAPAKVAAPAKKVERKTAAKKIVKKPAPVAKAPAKKVAPKVTKKTLKPVVKASAPAPAPAKPVLNTTAKPVVKAVVKVKAAKPVKEKKPKLVRDSFTIPKAEYSVLDALKQRAGKLGSSVKKSELLRAGIKALAAMADTALLSALKAVPAVKTGRPAKD